MTPAPISVKTPILVVEDNPVDVRLLRFALSQVDVWPTELMVADDGEKAISMMKEGPLPEFIVLDLNLPKLSGAEVLQWIRSNDSTRHIPVAVVSSSPMDEIQTKVAGARVEADCYYTKPMDVESFIQVARELAQCYWTLGRNAKATGS